MLAILGRCIKGKWLRKVKRCMWVRVSGRQIDDFDTLSTGSVTGWGGWCSGQRSCPLSSRLRSWLWSLLFALVGQRSTCSYASPACLRIVCGAIVERKASRHVVVTKHSWVYSHRSLHLFMPRNPNTPLLHFSNLGARFLEQILCFLYCGAWKLFFGHFGHVQGQAHVGLFQLYTTSLPCHRSRHLEQLQEISCCFK